MRNEDIYVGALVRFLNSIGGGRVARIVGDTAWVEDEDGFEIPTLLRECVVVEERDTFMPAYKPPVRQQARERNTPTTETTEKPLRSVREIIPDYLLEDYPTEPVATRPAHTYVPASGKVSVALLYTPVDDLKLGETSFATTLVNKSKYTILFTYAVQEELDKWLLRGHGTILPEQKLSLQELTAEELGKTNRINVQLLILAENPGIFKGNYSIDTRLDTKRFLKSSSFVPNDYSSSNSLVLDLVKDDQIALIESSPIDAKLLEQQLRSKMGGNKIPLPKPSLSNSNDPLVIDLHIDKLLDVTTGLDGLAILEYQIEKFLGIMEEYRSQYGKTIVFIHGKGNGILRNRLIRDLKHKYKTCLYQDASFEKYSYGATQVIIR